MKVALVTGVAGFIGSHIAERLINEGIRVIGIDNLSAGKTENIPKGIFRFFNLDVCEAKKIRGQLKDLGVDTIFHNAASKKNICLKDPQRDLQVNAGGTLMLLSIALDLKAKFIHASTGSVYGYTPSTITEHTGTHPCSYYGVSKLAGEKYVSLFGEMGLNTTILRYFHVYGPRQETDPSLGGVVAIFKDKILSDKPLTIHGDGDQVRSFTHVNDVGEANIRAATYKWAKGEVYNVASGLKITINEMAVLLMAQIGKRVPVRYVEPLPDDIYSFKVDNYKIKHDLGIEFTSFAYGIKDI